jgi:ribosomal protein S18 acetylase RimI-like enzyme
MVTLRPMTSSEFEAYIPGLRESYARERAKNLSDSLDSQLAEADKQISGLLPQGVQTPNHFLWQVMAEEEGTLISVGVLWVFLDTAAQKAFIYDIQIDQPYQGKGYGGDTLACLENELRPYAVRQIGLSVFGDNERAFRLYQKAGYYIVATHMQRDMTP